MVALGENLSNTQQMEARNLTEDFLDIFTAKSGRTSLIAHCIVLKAGCLIQKGLPRTPEWLWKTEEGDAKLAGEGGVLRNPSMSGVVPLCLSPKQDGMIQCCINF